MMRDFGSPPGALYSSGATATDLIVRQMVGTDSPLPSGNGVAARVLLELDRHDEARAILEAFAQSLDDNAEGMSALLEAAARYVRDVGPFAVSASAAEPGDQRERPPSPQEIAGRIVGVRAAWNGLTELRLELTIQHGFHIYAHEPGAAGLVATSLSVPAGARVEYPAGDERRPAFADESIRLYDGRVELAVRFPTPPRLPLRLGLTYQACDEQACLPPVTKTIEIGGR
jgi:hypothetical protein